MYATTWRILIKVVLVALADIERVITFASILVPMTSPAIERPWSFCWPESSSPRMAYSNRIGWPFDLPSHILAGFDPSKTSAMRSEILSYRISTYQYSLMPVVKTQTGLQNLFLSISGKHWLERRFRHSEYRKDQPRTRGVPGIWPRSYSTLSSSG